MSLNVALQGFADGLGQGVKQMASHSARAAATANGISAGAQAAQGAFNQASANNANEIGADRIAEQYGFNSGQASMANDFTKSMWEQSASWNEDMFNKQMEFNAEQARLNREWQERMMSTAYQRSVKDMEKAGLNPILAVTGGGISTGAGGGSAASVSSPQMSGATGQMASGGLMNGVSASEGNYTGQMEYMGGILGIMSALMSGISSAANAWALLGDATHTGKSYTLDDFIGDIFSGNSERLDKQSKNPNTKWNQFKNWASKQGERNAYYIDRFLHKDKYKDKQ